MRRSCTTATGPLAGASTAHRTSCRTSITKKQVETADYQRPDWRITCFFADKEYRGHGAAKAALTGALELISQAGGGMVESYPQDMRGKKTSRLIPVQLHRSLFEECGFAFVGPKGKNHAIMRKNIPAR